MMIIIMGHEYKRGLMEGEQLDGEEERGGYWG
jgi:hypothetical protein